MRKTYTKLLALAIMLLSGATAMAQNLVELEAEMFKSWSSPDADAVPTEETAVAEDGECGCEYNIFKEVGGGTVIYGHTNVYYLWYADLTGTKKIYFEGTTGVQLRVLMNRPAPEPDATDQHGGTTVERQVTLDADGKAELDVSDLEYVHLNCIKTGWGSPTGTVRSIKLEGTVKPVSGWIDQLNNGDLEGEDASSFFSKENAGDNAGAVIASTITDGIGVDDSRGIKVHSTLGATNDWDAQFWMAFPEGLPAGTKYRVSFDYKSSADARVSTQAHADPSDYIHYEMLGDINFTTDWQTFEREGEVTAQQSTAEKAFRSVAFNLSTDKAQDIDFYFDNLKFEIYKEKSPLGQIKATFDTDVVAIDFGGNTNIAQLVGKKKRVVFPNDCVKVSVNGEPTTLTSVEAKPDGRLYIFIDEGYAEDIEAAYLVSFTNPTDAAFHLTFTDGRWQGQDVPSFSEIAAEYEEGLANNFTYKADTPELVSADPEDGSFNLPLDLKEFKIVFDNNADAAQLQAKLDNEALTVTPAEGFASEFTLTRTGANDLTAGEHTLIVKNIMPEVDYGLAEQKDVVLTFSFGEVNVDPNDTVRVVLKDNFASYDGVIEPGWEITNGNELRSNEDGTAAAFGSGCRIIGGKSGDITIGAYLASRDRDIEGNGPAYLSFGEEETYPLALTPGKYQLSLNCTRWDRDGNIALRVNVLDPEGNVVAEDLKNVEPKASDNTVGATKFEIKFNATMEGNYVLKFYNCMWDGTTISYNGYDDCVFIGNIELKYIPSTAGVAETLMLRDALAIAKAALAASDSTRYDGADKDALKAAIEKYDGKTFTAPSKYINGAAELKAAAQAMNDHRVLCDDYDKQLIAAEEAVAKYAESKFATTATFASLKQTTEQYSGKVLTDNAELTAALAALNSSINNANGMFTEGPSRCNMTGIATLVERIRQGVETAQGLGIADDNWAVNAGLNALTDNDVVANALKDVIRGKVYTMLAEPGNEMFKAETDSITLEEVTPTYNMTVFVKNPNIYIWGSGSAAFNADNVPGWTTPEGFSAPGMTSGWSTVGSAEVPCDGMFQTWGGSYRVEQTITDLPVGVYTINFAYGERMSEEEATYEGSFVYAKTSETPVAAEGEEEEFAGTADVKSIGQSYPQLNTTVENIVVKDGILTIGVNAPSNSHTFFNEVQLLLAAPLDGFDYAAGIENVNNNGIVKRVEYFDLNGRRINAVRQGGLVIVKKTMTDGTVKTEKAIVK